ncbi:hypothetical protein [Rhodococcus xishaensis]|uniref:hypothetical protein n=1 Tax=Rhodococcus xishaensis TaxID=2487364 RepID=UPI0013E40838
MRVAEAGAPVAAPGAGRGYSQEELLLRYGDGNAVVPVLNAEVAGRPSASVKALYAGAGSLEQRCVRFHPCTSW